MKTNHNPSKRVSNKWNHSREKSSVVACWWLKVTDQRSAPRPFYVHSAPGSLVTVWIAPIAGTFRLYWLISWKIGIFNWNYTIASTQAAWLHLYMFSSLGTDESIICWGLRRHIQLTISNTVVYFCEGGPTRNIKIRLDREWNITGTYGIGCR